MFVHPSPKILIGTLSKALLKSTKQQYSAKPYGFKYHLQGIWLPEKHLIFVHKGMAFMKASHLYHFETFSYVTYA